MTATDFAATGKSYPPVRRCIYCGQTEGKLSREHIIPFSLGGNLVLPYASCATCADKTKRFEQIVARSIYGSLRLRGQFPTRNPSERPTHLSTIVMRPDGSSESVQVPAAEVPRAFAGLLLPVAGILSKRPPTNKFDGLRIVTKLVEEDLRQFLSKPGDYRIQGPRIDVVALSQLLCKIAHSFAVAELGFNTFKHFLPSMILETGPAHFPHYVGAAMRPLPKQGDLELHQLQIRRVEVDGTFLVTVVIRLFSFLDIPEYEVVVGEQ